MKVLITSESVNPPFSEGTTKSVLNWARALRSNGISVQILCVSTTSSDRRKIFDVDLRYTKASIDGFQGGLVNRLVFQKELVEQLEGFDLVHFADDAGGISFLPMLALIKLLHRKTVNSHHTIHFPKSIGLLEDLMFDMITVPSNRMLKALVRERVPSKKVGIVPPCVDNEVFCQRNRFEIRERLGLPSDSFTIFTTGHFRRGRRLIPLIKSVHEMARNRKKIQLLIGWTGIGEEAYKRDVLSIAKKYESVKIVPPTDEIHLYYSAADIYVLTADSDCVIEFPMSLIEAFSSGVPVLAFDVNAVSEIVENNVSGYVVRDGDFDGIKAKIDYLMRNDSLLKEFAVRARDVVSERYSFSVVGKRLLTIYKESMGSK